MQSQRLDYQVVAIEKDRPYYVSTVGSHFYYMQ